MDKTAICALLDERCCSVRDLNTHLLVFDKPRRRTAFLELTTTMAPTLADNVLFQQDARACGSDYRLIRNVDDVRRWLDEN